MRGRVPRLVSYTRGRSGKPRDDRGNLLHLERDERAAFQLIELHSVPDNPFLVRWAAIDDAGEGVLNVESD
jgi:hypothetical protein